MGLEMVRMQLPLDFSRVVIVDPLTSMMEVYDHPILEVYLVHAFIKQHIHDWLVDHNEFFNFGYDRMTNMYYIDFPTEEDRIAFVLKWL